MKNESGIHNMDSLEKEIYRLQLDAKAKEKQLEENATWIRKNARQLFIDGLFCRNKRKADRETDGEGNNFKSPKWTAFVDKLTNQFAERAAEGLENLAERIFTKKKK